MTVGDRPSPCDPGAPRTQHGPRVRSHPVADAESNRHRTVRYERRADILAALLQLAWALLCARKLQPLCTTATSPSALHHPPMPGRFRLGAVSRCAAS
jgi:hypothetical protein